MKLPFDTLKRITFGATRIWQENGHVRFGKCTQKQVDAWYDLDAILGERAETTTGIRLDFHTNSSHFSFSAAMGNKFEIYLNGVFTYDIRFNSLDEKKFDINLCQKENTANRITLILPSHEIAALISVELDDGATVIPHEFDHKFLFIGDSITQGWDSGYDSLSYAYRVSRFFNADSIIQGVGGGYFHDTIFDDNIDYDPDAVIVAFGTNDWGVRDSIKDLEENAKKFLEKLCAKYSKKTIFGISPIWRADDDIITKCGSFYDVCSVVKNQILEHNVTLVDGLTLVPQFPEFFADGFLHPNALGFGIYAENLISVMAKHIKIM